MWRFLPKKEFVSFQEIVIVIGILIFGHAMRFLRPGWIMIYLLLGWFAWSTFFSTPGVVYTGKEVVTVGEGKSLTSVYDQLGIDGLKKLSMKRFLNQNPESFTVLQPGSYQFSGSYSPGDFFSFLERGPQVSYETITVLEGWSIFDIDRKLTSMGLIEEGDYREYVTSSEIIKKYQGRYEFLQQAADDLGSDLVTLEGFLYPETFKVDAEKNIIDQLVSLQLKEFNKRVWTPYFVDRTGIQDSLDAQGYDFPLSFYGALRLASVIEKEERRDENKPKIASIFYNRLDNNMRLDADISLCYGLQEPYESCTPSVIVNHLGDELGGYNTRLVMGLTPTPIANIHVSSFDALFEAEKSPFFFYLHDDQGQIHLSTDLSEHNSKKSKYIN